jgi:metallo-beta-lactamase class B
LLKAHQPFRIHGNTWFVGTEGLSAILITSEYGHVLIDAGLPESAPLIKANIEAAGFSISQVKAILSSAAHAEFAGGIAELQRLSGAQVYSLRPAESVLRTGKLSADDPRSADAAAGVAPVPFVSILHDDQLLGVGSVRLRVMATPGASPGGASWSWESCEGGTCLGFLYVADLAASAAGSYRFKAHPQVLKDFEESFQRVEKAQCDVLLTARPESSQLFARLDPQGGSRAASIKDNMGCARYARSARDALSSYIAAER